MQPLTKLKREQQRQTKKRLWEIKVVMTYEQNTKTMNHISTKSTQV